MPKPLQIFKNMHPSIRHIILFALSSFHLLGQFGAKTDPSVIKDPSGYKVRAGDVLSISVDGENECTSQSKVNDGGTIEVKYLGKILVAGQTVEKIRNIISTKYKSERIFNRAVVRVQITQYSQRMVFLSGSVNRKVHTYFHQS